VKSRLLAITNSKTLEAGGRDSGPKRPTLKRRKEGDDPSQPSATGDSQPKDKPTLKRRDSEGKPADTKPPETKPPDQL